jgi:hypothetical protein
MLTFLVAAFVLLLAFEASGMPYPEPEPAHTHYVVHADPHYNPHHHHHHSYHHHGHAVPLVYHG